jgi:nuclear pore complex protein Nup50
MKPSRVGTNNVSLVCIPNPPIDRNRVDEPTTLLIRVKTASDADQLLAKVLENL